jgi:lysophospholipase L1-like esterase
MEYVRFAALGDSASCGVGDPTPRGWRGWAQLLADAIGAQHHVSFCKLAVPGAVTSDVRRHQLPDALAHRPAVASLVVGFNDVLRAGWNPEQIRTDLLFCAEALARQGTLLVTVRFHDHTRVFGVPRLLSQRLQRRIETLNEIYDEVHDKYGTLRLDLADDPATYSRRLWSFDRLHPSEEGHRLMAYRIAALLNAEGLEFPLPSLTTTSTPPGLRENLHVLVHEIAPWLGRRVRDLAPTMARRATVAG